MKVIARTIVSLLVVLTLASGALSANQSQRLISMDFKSVDIHIVIKFISEVTGKNFIVDNAVGGRVTIYSPTKISVDEAYLVFQSILEVNNLTIVPSGKVYKILPAAVGRTKSVPTVHGSKAVSADSMVTQIITLKNTSASEVAKLVTPMVGPSGLVNVYQPNNTLIVTAAGSNLKRILDVTNEVDRSRYAPKFESIEMKFATAKDVAANVNKIMGTRVKDEAAYGKKAVALIVADDRTNRVLVMADEDSMATIQGMIKEMDVPTPKGSGDINFVALENAKAEDVAKVLNSLIERQVSANKEEKVLSRNVKVVADKATNSLVITASPTDYELLKGTIAKLDIMRKQVYIEALIMEVSDDAEFNFGVNWAAGGGGGDTFLYGSSNNGGGTISFGDNSIAGFPSGGSIGVILDNAFRIGGKTYGIQNIISAVSTDNNYKILSTPQLMTLDNEKAKVDVVDNIPYVKESKTDSSNTSYQSQSIDYKDVGVKLEITPHISTKGTLRLEVHQEVSRVISSQVTLGSGGQTLLAPTTKKREVETTIQMKDGQTVVIAGLIGEDDTVNNSKVPGLGDIPGLGWLFKSKKNKNTRTNLFVFLTPHVVDTYGESQDIYRDKLEAIKDVELGHDGRGMPRMSPPAQLKPVVVR